MGDGRQGRSLGVRSVRWKVRARCRIRHRCDARRRQPDDSGELTVTFVTGADGKVTHFILSQGGRIEQAKRIE
jgi:hypothetical protein